ncbi:NADAR family protein [Ectopseudomonas chengduensis]
MTSRRYKKHPAEDCLLRTYVRGEVVVVYKTKEDFGGLSNMASGYPLQINGVRILTSEALYQACRFPHMPELQREIIGQHSPMTAKMKSKPHRKDSRSDWDEVRYKVMRWCLRVKLAQNYEEFGRLLLATRDRPIVEQSRKDDYWGAKLMDETGDTLIGQNVLGRLLMELREKLKDDSEGRLKTVPPLCIPDFLLLGKPIETVTNPRDGREQKSQHALF